MTVINLKNEPAAEDYQGCGKAWVAWDDDRILAIRYMDAHRGCYTGYSPAAQKHAGVTRYCPSAQRSAETLNKWKFLEWRSKAKAELSQLGTVIAGMCSCWEFIPERFTKDQLIEMYGLEWVDYIEYLEED